MKKFIVMLSLIMAVLLTGCSCNSVVLLSFSNNWAGSDGVFAGFTETNVYDVKLITNFHDDKIDFSQSEGVSDILTYDFYGTYVEKLEIIEVRNFNKFESSVLEDSTNNQLLKLTTNLSLTAEYTVKGGEKQTYHDYVKSESYFLNTDNALAPIYAESDNNYSTVNLTNQNPISTLHFKTTTEYSKYRMHTVSTILSYDNGISEVTEKGSSEYYLDYDYKSLIDNAYLLFALRNLPCSQGSSKTLPVVATAYNGSQNLTVNYPGDREVSDANETKWATKLYTFIRAHDKQMGNSQLVFIQRDKVNGVNNSLIIKYVFPLAEYSTNYDRLGALEYKLKSTTRI